MRSRKFKSPFLNFISSLKMAAFLLLLIAACIVWATVTQSIYGASQNWVNESFYHTWWFITLQVLVFINMWVATIRIFQGTYKQIGVITIHVGVSLLMIGSALTHGWGVVGARVDLWEGESSNVALETERFVAEIEVNSQDNQQHKRLTIDSPFFAKTQNKTWEIPLGKYTLKATSFHPYGTYDYHVLTPGLASDPRGIHLKLSIPEMPMMPQEMIRSQPPLNVWSKGSFQISYQDVALDPLRENVDLLLPQLKISLKEDQNKYVFLDPMDKKKHVHTLGEYHLQFDRFVTSFIIGEQGEKPDDGLWRNPTFIFKWWRRDDDEKKVDYKFVHYDFHQDSPFATELVDDSFLAHNAQTPDLTVVTFNGQQPTLFKRQFPGCWEVNPFYLQENGQYHCVLDFSSTEVTFIIDQLFDHVGVQKVPHRIDDHVVSSSMSLNPLVYWSLLDGKGSEIETNWGLLNDKVSFQTPQGDLVDVIYKQKEIPLDFEVTLLDVTQENDPGQSSPATWFSDIKMTDKVTGQVKQFRINMNDPIDYKGFRFFQANYRPPDPMHAHAEQSGLMVAKDPGFKIYYAGFLVCVVGMLLNFYAKDFLARFDKGKKL